MSFLARGEARGRVLTANAALVIAESDGQNGTIILTSTNTATIAATFSWDATVDTLGGAKFEVYMQTRSSSGSYTIACTYGGSAGDVTFNAQHEYARFHRIGSTLYCTALIGATFA